MTPTPFLTAQSLPSRRETADRFGKFWRHSSFRVLRFVGFRMFLLCASTALSIGCGANSGDKNIPPQNPKRLADSIRPLDEEVTVSRFHLER
jgi:hypothetical protein